MQAEQFIFHSRKYCKFGLRFLPLVVIENALPALISNTLCVTIKTERATTKSYFDNHTFLPVDNFYTGGRTSLPTFNFDTQIDRQVDKQQLSKSDL